MRINLLPYREERRAALRQRFKTLSIFVCAIGVLISLFIYLYVTSVFDNQANRNEALNKANKDMGTKVSKIKDLEKEIAYLVEQQDLIEKLKTERYNGIALLKELATALPEGVYLTKFTQKSMAPIPQPVINQPNRAQLVTKPKPMIHGFELTIEGATLSNVRVATFVNSLNASAYFENAVLNEVKLEEIPSFIRNSNFVLTVNSKTLVSPTEVSSGVGKTSSDQKDSPFVTRGTDALKKMTESVAKNPGENQ